MLEENGHASGEEADYLRFTVAAIDFGMEVSVVREVVKYSGFKPAAGRAFLDGKIELRGMRVPVIDLAALFSLERAAGGEARIIVTRLEGHVIGLVADSVVDIVTVPAGSDRVTGESALPYAEYISFSVKSGASTIHMLDAATLLNDKQRARLAVDAPREKKP